MLRTFLRPLYNPHSFQKFPKASISGASRYYAAMSANKKARTHPPYELLYWPGIPGRGEFIRLAFEAAGVPYKDVANESEDGAFLQCKPYIHV
jgi:hypothetical protein